MFTYKRIVFLLFLSLNFSALSAESLRGLKKFYTDLGYKKAEVEGILLGYKMAVKDFKVLVEANEAEIEALQAGKYMVKKGKITYPKIWKVREGDSYRVKIEAPTVEREFSAEDLYILPLLNGEGHSFSKKTSTKRKFSQRGGSSDDIISLKESIPYKPKKNVSNSFQELNLNHINVKKSRPNTVSSSQKRKTLLIKNKSALTEETLNAFGLKYSSTSKGYRVTFSGEREMTKFCESLTGDSSCSSLR